MKPFSGFTVAVVLFALGLSLAPVPAQKAESPPKLGAPDKPKPKHKHGRGHKRPSKQTLKLMYELSNLKHKALKAAVPTVTLAAYDARTEKALCVPPVGDQDGCGDCYMWSGCKACSACLMTNKLVPQDGTFFLAPSYGLDCQSLGGCDGGDEYEVAGVIRDKGWPSLAQYGGDGYTPGSCKSTANMTMYKVDSLVLVGTQQGVADTQAIKNYIWQSGFVSVAGAAGDDWDNVTANSTITGTSSDINHAIGLVGWDDAHDNGDSSKGAWILQNNWGTSWGNAGYVWIKYGADSIGTESFVAWNNTQAVKPFPAPPPGPPPPPGPIPPTPPTPPTPPANPATSITITYADGTTQVVSIPSPPPPLTITISAEDAAALIKAAQDLQNARKKAKP